MRVEKHIYLGIGEAKVAKGPAVLAAVGVGSCVVVCLWDPLTKVGGMAHTLLARRPKGSKLREPLKYADCAIHYLLWRMAEFGCSKHRLVAKVFGGADMFSESRDIGDKNISEVREILAEHGVKIVAEDVGGTQGRNVWFDVETGRVVVGKVLGPTMEC